MTNNEPSLDKGLLIVLSGPSGVGKNTVCSALCKSLPQLVYSVSATTRNARQGEIDGVHYFFKQKADFEKMIEQDKLLEWAKYVGNYYGTPQDFVERTLNQGKDIILEIEVQGALKVQRKYPEAVYIFLVPPSFTELRSRIQNRGTDSIESITKRLYAAEEEMKLMEHYDYAVLNDQVQSACEKIQAIIIAEHCKINKTSVQGSKIAGRGVLSDVIPIN